MAINKRLCYSDISKLKSFKERYEYLKLGGTVGVDTFGFDRYLNQQFYKSEEWLRVRNEIILRDNGCDLGIEDRDIYGRIIIHHMNPITADDIIDSTDRLFDPENLICVSHRTHQAIHYGDDSLLSLDIVERSPNDTCPWKK